jgi:hypothetical protein
MDKQIETALNNWFNKNYEVNSNNKIKAIGKNRYYSESDIYSAYITVMNNIGMDYASGAEFSNWIKTKYSVIQTPTKSKSAISDWITNQINDPSSMFRISNNGKQIEYGKGDTWVNADNNNLTNWLIEMNDKDNGGPGYLVGTIKATLDNLLKQGEYKAVGIIQDHIKYDPTKVAVLDKFLDDVYAYWNIKESKEIFRTLMKQWMWCLKRKIWNQPVRHHIWLNFFGTTGFGKSEFIKRFLSEFKAFFAQGGLEIFADQGREYKKFCNNFVLFFDELSQGNQSALADAKLDVNTLNAIKASITGDVMDVRILGGQEQNKINIRYTPISAANYHLFDIVYDETSMRRFFEFNIERINKPTEQDFEYINGVLEHSVEAFQGIDEYNSTGYFLPETEIGKQISEIQRHYLPTKTTVNAWINKCHIIKGKTPSDLMYDEYKEWCKKYGYNPRNLDGYNNILRTRFGVDEDGNIMIDASNGSASTFVNDLLKSDDEDTSEIDSLVDSEPTKVTPNVNDVDVEDDTDTFFAKLANREN